MGHMRRKNRGANDASEETRQDKVEALARDLFVMCPMLHGKTPAYAVQVAFDSAELFFSEADRRRPAAETAAESANRESPTPDEAATNATAGAAPEAGAGTTSGQPAAP